MKSVKKAVKTFSTHVRLPKSPLLKRLTADTDSRSVNIKTSISVPQFRRIYMQTDATSILCMDCIKFVQRMHKEHSVSYVHNSQSMIDLNRTMIISL